MSLQILFIAFIQILFSVLAAAQDVLTVRSAVLIINNPSSQSSATESVTDVLRGYGIPYDIVSIPSTGFVGNFSLEDSTVQGKYSVIVLADSKLASITAAQYTQLNDYESKYRAKRVIMNQFPGAEWNSAYVANSACCGNNVEEYWRFNAASTGFLSATGIKTDSQLSTLGLWHYSATITNTSNTVPLLITPKGVGAVIVNQPNNRQEMVFFIPFGSFSITSVLLNHAWITWGLRNLYPGQRRVYLSTQIDDVFLSTELWDPAIKNTSEAKVFRISGNDLKSHISWNTAFKARAPAGSNYTIELAFNANGVLEQSVKNPVQPTQGDYDADYSFVKPAGTGSSFWPANYPTNPAWTSSLFASDGLFKEATTSTGAAFLWLSHTFTHLSLNNVSKSDVAKEIQYNQMFLSKTNFIQSTSFSANAIVTPRITGFNNSDALAAMYENGIRSAVGDNSRNIFNPTNIHWGITTTTATYGFNGFFIIPRSPTEIYFHCSLPSEDLSVYNYVVSQNPLFASYVTNDFNVLLSREAQRVVRMMLLLRKDGHMFHQANMRVADTGVPTTTLPNGLKGKYSLLMQWVEYINWQYMKLVSWPIVTLKQTDLHRNFVDREARDKCNYNMYVSFNPSTSIITNVAVKSVSACTVPVSSPNSFVNPTSVDSSEKLSAVDPYTYWVRSPANGVVNFNYGTSSTLKW